MRRPKRSPYAPPGMEDPNAYASPYAVPDAEDDEHSPLMRQAMEQNAAAANRGYGGGAGEVADALTNADLKENFGPDEGPSAEAVSRYTAPPAEESVYADVSQAADGGGSMSWVDEAPEAAGAGPFKTTPENAPPRSKEPIRNADVPKIGDSPSERSQSKTNPTRNPSQDAIDRTDAKIEKLREKMGGAVAFFTTLLNPHTQQLNRDQMNALLQQRRNFTADAARYDDLRGTAAKYTADQRLASAKLRSDKDVEVQRLKNAQDEHRETAIKNTGRIDDSGRFVYVDPDTHQWKEPDAIPGEPARGNVLDADNRGATSPYSPPTAPYRPKFATPAEAKERAPHYFESNTGDVTEVEPGKTPRQLGRFGKTHEPRRERADEEERIERDARTAARTAVSDFRAGKLSTEKGAPTTEDEAFKAAYIRAGGESFAILHPRGEVKTVENEATGERERWASDGKKFVPPPKKKKLGRAPFARSHG